MLKEGSRSRLPGIKSFVSRLRRERTNRQGYETAKLPSEVACDMQILSGYSYRGSLSVIQEVSCQK